MFNHNRGLWGYTGAASDGRPLTIQSTGMGGPSAAIVISELADFGVTRMIRVGTCGALDGALALGDLLIASDAIAADGTSRALGADGSVPASPGLLQAMPALPRATVVSTDLFYDDRDGVAEQWIIAGAQAVEMEAAALYALAARRGFQAAAILIVSDIVHPARSRIGPEALRDAEHRMGQAALRALAEPAGEGTGLVFEAETSRT
jgi:uridine phosphorylase